MFVHFMVLPVGIVNAESPEDKRQITIIPIFLFFFNTKYKSPLASDLIFFLSHCTRVK